MLRTASHRLRRTHPANFGGAQSSLTTERPAVVCHRLVGQLNRPASTPLKSRGLVQGDEVREDHVWHLYCK